MSDKICRTCGYTDCENVTGKIGYCPRWHVPDSPHYLTDPDQMMDFADHTLTAIGKILEDVKPTPELICYPPSAEQMLANLGLSDVGPRHAAPPVGSEAREATASPWIGRHRNG